MRINLPVTQQAIALPEGVTLMSTTDLHSHMTYANEAFVRISGFSCEELIGQPHNQVRHPDMPKEAFADMWATLKAGDSWTALVKNRSKTGDHYWVRANATPVRQGGDVVGYMSVRTRPAEHEVQAAEQLYAQRRGGQLKGRIFHRGALVWAGWQRWRSWRQLMGTSTRLNLAALIAVLPVALLAAGQARVVSGPVGWGGLAGWVAACLAGALLACLWLERQIGSPLRQIREQAMVVAAGQVAEGLQMDRVDGLGMLARAINQAGLNLRSLLDDVGQQVGGIRVASAEIAAGNVDLRERTEESVSSLQETAAAMEELGATVKHNAEAARRATELANAASAFASQGGQSVADVVCTMADIADRSRRVADIIGTIDGIAFQTNILALNAAVEAARAGEQGRGFAVVAGEVRALAQRSANAAKEIRGLIQDSVGRIEGGAKLARQAGENMGELVQQVRQVNQLVSEIGVASAEQAGGIDLVTQAVAELDRMAQQNAALVEQSAEAASRLHERTQRLEAAMSAYQGRQRII